jgi:hypothetical protein
LLIEDEDVSCSSIFKKYTIKLKKRKEEEEEEEEEEEINEICKEGDKVK